MGTFDNRVAIVTGGARGIGEGCSKRFARDGARVVVVDLDGEAAEQTAAAIRAEGGMALGLGVDVTSREQVSGMVARTVAEFGQVDILVTCAGILRDNLLFKLTEDDWDAVIDTHLKGTFLCVQAAQAEMVKRNYGRIVVISSTSALGTRGQTNYAAAKAGIQGLCKTAAIELGRYGITVNCIAPGFIETRMTRATAARQGLDFQQLKAAACTQIPVGRVGQPDDVAQTAAFFCDERSGFVSGQVVYVAGGPKN